MHNDEVLCDVKRDIYIQGGESKAEDRRRDEERNCRRAQETGARNCGQRARNRV